MRANIYLSEKVLRIRYNNDHELNDLLKALGTIHLDVQVSKYRR